MPRFLGFIVALILVAIIVTAILNWVARNVLGLPPAF